MDVHRLVPVSRLVVTQLVSHRFVPNSARQPWVPSFRPKLTHTD
jgi:hypothetical protein